MQQLDCAPTPTFRYKNWQLPSEFDLLDIDWKVP